MVESNKAIWLAVFVIVSVLIYLLAPILMPFISAAVLAYIADPLVDKLEKKMSRTLSVSIVFFALSIIALLFLLIVLPLVERQIVILAEKLPLYIDRAQNYIIPLMKEHLGIDVGLLDLNTLKQSLSEYWKAAGGIAANIVSSISRSGLILAGWIANFLLMLVVTFYLLRDWDTLVAKIHALIPRKNEKTIVGIAKESDEVLGAFFRGQLLVMFVLSIVYTVGLMIVGIDTALLIGALSGIVSFVPYLGFIVGIVVASIAALMQFQEILPLFYVVIVFMTGQMLEGMLLTPLLVGDKIGLHPVAVIFAVLAGGQLFGFVGILLALPVAAVIAVVLRHVHGRYKLSELYAE
ncbi:MAG: AI-2E family transporter [Gammaproteobacteria bacterium]|nr:AI-2E family transporter [Gammaproteobacteria bacterium]MCW8988750.1 AI-2E family transporter [Gammaproteobacteria bacterium]MCW9030638.1 AI-2E family transporter [Gammaproteobacteria bacterium]